MKVPTAIGGTALRPRLTAVGCGALILLGIAVLSACSSSTSTPPSESSFTIISSLTSSGTGLVTNNAVDGGATDTTGTATVTVTPTQTTTVTVSPSPSPSPIPTQAPVTGGGGTAGFQDGLLLVIGAAAIAAGAGGIAYRRRLNRRR
jgi:hypothetical protein